MPKQAIAVAHLTADGIAGDRWNHPKIHGGPRKAVLLMTAESLDEITNLGFPVFAGALGENITTRGLDRRELRGGQRYSIGEAMIELTELREPCRTLWRYGRSIGTTLYNRAARAGDPASYCWGLSGFYAAVLRAGVVKTGDPLTRLE